MNVIFITGDFFGGGKFLFPFQGEMMNRISRFVGLVVRSAALLALLGAAESLVAGVCEGTQYGIRYRIRCWSDGTCIGSAVHSDGRITQAVISREEAELACSQLL